MPIPTAAYSLPMIVLEHRPGTLGRLGATVRQLGRIVPPVFHPAVGATVGAAVAEAARADGVRR